VGEIHFKIRYFCTTQGSSGDFASAATWHVLDGSYHRFIDTSPIDQLVEHIGLKFFFFNGKSAPERYFCCGLPKIDYGYSSISSYLVLRYILIKDELK
jgi:hypothetical protein